MTSKWIKLLLATVLPCAVALGVAPAVQARTIGAYSGQPLDNIARTCFSESNGGVVGSIGCSNDRWAIYLPVDAARSYTVSFTGQLSNDLGLVGCRAYAVSTDGSFSGFTDYQTAPVSSTLQTVTLGSVSVPAGGNLFVVCNIQSGSVGTINWN